MNNFLVFEEILLLSHQNEIYRYEYMDVLIITAIHLFILLKFLEHLIINFAHKTNINFFLVVLVLYELTILTKNIEVLTGLTLGYTYFYITGIFEIFIGLFFILFKEGNPKLILQLN